MRSDQFRGTFFEGNFHRLVQSFGAVENLIQWTLSDPVDARGVAPWGSKMNV